MSATVEDLKALAVQSGAEVESLDSVRAQIVELFEGAKAAVAPPPPPGVRTPPPPPPAAQTAPPPPPVAPASVWGELSVQAHSASDPIAAFAPPPSMDWGPERSSRFRRRKG